MYKSGYIGDSILCTSFIHENALLAANTALRYSTNVVCIVNGRVV